MLNKNYLQQAIQTAVESDLGAVAGSAFKQTEAGWVPQPDCLTAYYSSGEAVVCSVLLAFYFEMYGRPADVVIPDKEYENSLTDLIWPGGWYFFRATSMLSNNNAWKAIKTILPGRFHAK